MKRLVLLVAACGLLAACTTPYERGYDRPAPSQTPPPPPPPAPGAV